MGSVTNVFEYLYAADVFALSSRTEGLSNALLEAMSIGLPVVVTDLAGNRELIRDGEQGYLVPANPELFAMALERLLKAQELGCHMGISGYQRVVHGFGIHAVARMYRSLYRSLLGLGRSYELANHASE